MLTLAGAWMWIAEAAWERRTEREMAWCREDAPAGPPPRLLAAWWHLAPFPRAASAAFYADHMRAELVMGRRAVAAAIPCLVVGDVVLARSGRVRWAVTAALALLPVSKLVARSAFNEVESVLPITGPLAMLREQEVLWGLAALSASSRPWSAYHAALPQVPATRMARRCAASADLRHPDAAAFRKRAARCRDRRLRRQAGVLGICLLAAAGLVLRAMR